MNSYLNELSRLLANSLSPEEFNNVMQYYTEYFADAGIENQEEVIKELGTPKELADKIIAEYNSRQETETNKQESVVVQPQKAVVETTVKPRRRLAKGWIVLIVIGAILFSLPIVFACIKKTNENIEKVFDKIALVEHTYESVEEFEKVIIDVAVANVEIVKGDEFAVEYVLGEDTSMNFNGSTLTIEDDSFGSVFASELSDYGDAYVKVYVPDDTVVDIETSVDVGDISIKDVEFKTLSIEADTGDINIEADSFDGDLQIAADIGKVEIKGYLGCDMDVEADIGNVNITSYYSSDSYSCNIDTDLGKESISDEGGEELEEEYDIDVIADMGNVKIVFCDN